MKKTSVLAGVMVTVFGLSNLKIYSNQMKSQWKEYQLVRESNQKLITSSLEKQLTYINQSFHPSKRFDLSIEEIKKMEEGKFLIQKSLGEVQTTLNELDVPDKEVPTINYGPTTINFDEHFPFMDVEYDCVGEDAQYYLDKGYLIKYAGDYYHHNTSEFINTFCQLESGKEVIIGGTTYSCTGIEHATYGEYSVVTDHKEQIFDNDTTEIITCDGPIGSTKRLVARLR